MFNYYWPYYGCYATPKNTPIEDGRRARGFFPAKCWHVGYCSFVYQSISTDNVHFIFIIIIFFLILNLVYSWLIINWWVPTWKEYLILGNFLSLFDLKVRIVKPNLSTNTVGNRTWIMTNHTKYDNNSYIHIIMNE